jgi:formylglycine-generating enzyme
MKKIFIIFGLLSVLFVSCVVEEDETVPDNDVDINDIDHQEDKDVPYLNDEENEEKEDKSENEPDEDPLPDTFCFSGGAILYEGEQQYKVCPGFPEKMQKQICKNGKWRDEADCVDNFVLVSEGSFLMGCNPEKEGTCEEDNVPSHEVEVSPFYIDKFEVTVERFLSCVEDGACDETHFRTTGDSYKCNIGNDERENHPANCVTWFGADQFCKWAGGRLPTEAEWEKAARGTDGSIYPWGDSPVGSCDNAVVESTTSGCGSGGTFPVGSKPEGKSPYGLYDATGNVAEYVNDWYNSKFYSLAEASEKDTKGPAKPEVDGYRVCRGGSFLYGERRTRSAYRSGCKDDDTSIDFGFRCAKDIK